jgi:hypothetical protein
LPVQYVQKMLASKTLLKHRAYQKGICTTS